MQVETFEGWSWRTNVLMKASTSYCTIWLSAFEKMFSKVLTCGVIKKFLTFCSLAQRILVRLTWTKKFKCCAYYGNFEKRICEYIGDAPLKENELFVKKGFQKMANFEGWHQKSWFCFQIPKKTLVTFPNRFKIGFHK